MSSYYANKTKREELNTLSLKVFGTKSKWQYFVKERGYTIESIESQMKLLEQQVNEAIKENINVDSGSQRQDSLPRKRTIKLSRKERRRILRARAKRQRRANRNKT